MKETQIKKKIQIDYKDPKYEGLSKKRIKKLARKEFKKQYIKEKKQSEPIIKKEKIVQKQILKKEPHEKIKLNKKEQRIVLRNMMVNAPKVIIDADFGHTFDQYSIHTFVRQFQECHSYQAKSKKPLNLQISCVDKMTMEKVNEQNGQNWLMDFCQDNLLKQNNEKIIYLSPEADEIMEKFEEDKIYVIGGIVDHNSLKGVTYEKSKEFKIKAQKFPISKYVKMKAAPVLSVNQCFNILLHLYNGCSWEETLQKIIPKRKRLEQIIKQNYS